jgi:hypothetical protein
MMITAKFSILVTPWRRIIPRTTLFKQPLRQMAGIRAQGRPPLYKPVIRSMALAGLGLALSLAISGW